MGDACATRPAHLNMAAPVTVVIATRDRADLLLWTLDRLAELPERRL